MVTLVDEQSIGLQIFIICFSKNQSFYFVVKISNKVEFSPVNHKNDHNWKILSRMSSQQYLASIFQIWRSYIEK